MRQERETASRARRKEKGERGKKGEAAGELQKEAAQVFCGGCKEKMAGMMGVDNPVRSPYHWLFFNIRGPYAIYAGRYFQGGGVYANQILS